MTGALFLSPAHRRSLEVDSAIDPGVLVERGYRTVTTKAELNRLGFRGSQALVPTLLIPVYNARGDISLYHHRPDAPRFRDGKPTKYEFPAGSAMAVDVPPVAREKVRDPAVPLFVTEGVKKADAAVSRGLCCVALLGVWNFRGINEVGGLTALPDWDEIAFKGKDMNGAPVARPVYVCFDSDVMVKLPVHQALCRLSGFLKSRGADVRYLYLPAPGGAKIGLDDFFAAGHSVEDLMSHASARLREPPEGEREAGREAPYVSTPEGIRWRKPTGEGSVLVPLTNFDARIVSDVLEDDGAESRRVYTLEATLKGRTSRFDLPAEQFAAMNWPAVHMGARAILHPGQAIRDHARTAIQMLSDVDERRVRAHTGWVETGEGAFAYCHGGGFIGADPGGSLQARLPEPLQGFHLPAPPPPGSPELAGAVASVLRLLSFGKNEVTVPVIAAAFRAVLGRADFSVFAAGPTGVFKSELAALAQQFYGATMTARNLPADWSATDNYLEGLAFSAKDALLVIDEFVPRGGLHDREKSHAKADRVLRAQGNNAARGRMRADGSLRPPKPPRGLILSTGEDVPQGQSLRARTFVIEVSPGDLPAEGLTACQRDARDGKYALAMSAFLAWLAPRYAQMRGDLPRRLESLRVEAAGTGSHRRTPEIAVQLAQGLEYFLRFASEAGALEQDTKKAFLPYWKAILCAASRQSNLQEDNEPTRRFLSLLSAALASGRAHLATPEGKAPDETVAAASGWRERWTGAGVNERRDWEPHGDRIGFVDGESAYLIPDASYQCAGRMASESGDGVAVKPRTLHRRMEEKGLLVTTDKARQRLTVRITAGGSRVEVLHIQRAKLLPHEPSQPSQSSLDEEA